MTNAQSSRVSTGVPGLDAVLGGGLPPFHLYLLEGDPGAGKTTLALQFLLAGARNGEPGLYVTLSESEAELRSIAQSHGWSLDGLTVCDLQTSDLSLEAQGQYTLFHPSEIELSETTKSIIGVIDRVRPKRVVFDSLSEMRLLARDSLRYRRQVLALKHYLAARGVTVMVLDIAAHHEAGFPIDSVAHGVIRLGQVAPEYGGQRRRLRVQKMRGVAYRNGYHDFLILRGGLEVYPRLVANEEAAATIGTPQTTGISELDAMLGGGIQAGTSTMFLGPSGVGKSSIAAKIVCAAAERGERAAIYLFDESPATYLTRSSAMGLPMAALREARTVEIRQVDPAELSPGEFSWTVRRQIDGGVRTVVIDSLNGYLTSMPDEQHLALHMHELLAFLAQRHVSTILLMAQHGIVGETVRGPIDLSYIADSVVLLRYFEAFGEIRQAISVLKRRTGPHQRTIRELIFGPGGMRIGDEIKEFHGVLAGELRYVGGSSPLLQRDAHG